MLGECSSESKETRTRSDCTLRYCEASFKQFAPRQINGNARSFGERNVCVCAHTRTRACSLFYPRPMTNIGSIRIAMTYIRVLRWKISRISKRDKSAVQDAPYIRWECPFLQVDPQKG